MVLMKVLMVLMEGSPDDLDALITHRVQDCSLVVHVVSPFWNNLKTGNCTDSSSCYRAALLYYSILISVISVSLFHIGP